MKNTFLLLVLLVSTSTWACDACGCRPSGGQWGSGFDFVSSVGFTYQFGSFISTHPSLFNSESTYTSSETFRSLQLVGRIRLSDRWMLTAQLPYVYNRYETPDEIQTIQSFGDAQLSGVFRAIQPSEESRLGLDIQAGLKLPTGKWEDVPFYLPAAILPGTGSWDFTLSARTWYALGESSAVEWQLNSLLPTANRDGDKFGPRFSTLVGYQNEVYSNYYLQVLLTANVQFMYDGVDWVEKSGAKEKVDFTSGYFTSINGGIQLNYNNWILAANAGAPMIQEFGQGLVEAQPTFLTQITYSF